ncbi:NapC/NirT family cytochrome c, partial [Escherichia coli]
QKGIRAECADCHIPKSGIKKGPC